MAAVGAWIDWEMAVDPDAARPTKKRIYWPWKTWAVEVSVAAFESVAAIAAVVGSAKSD